MTSGSGASFPLGIAAVSGIGPAMRCPHSWTRWATGSWDEETRTLLFEVTAIPGITIIPSPVMLVWVSRANQDRRRDEALHCRAVALSAVFVGS